MKIERLMTTTISKRDSGELEIRATVRLVDLERLESELDQLKVEVAESEGYNGIAHDMLELQAENKNLKGALRTLATECAENNPGSEMEQAQYWIDHALANPTEGVEE